MCDWRGPGAATNISPKGQVIYVRAVIVKEGDGCARYAIEVKQPGECVATLVVDAKEIRREDRERLGMKESA